MMGPAGSEEGGRAESWLEGTKAGKNWSPEAKLRNR